MKIKSIIPCVLFALTSSVYASGFQLFEGNGTNVQNFGAGGVADASDASIGFYNPAGLTQITNPQFVFAGNEIFFKADLNGADVHHVIFDFPNPGPNVIPDTATTVRGEANGGTDNIVPAFSVSAPLSNRLTVGFTASAPFGLETDYNDTSFIRYTATDTQLLLVDLTPSFGFKLDDRFSVGAGMDIERIRARFDQVAGVPLPPPANQFALDTFSANKATGWGYGYHLGLFWNVNESTKAGISYQSTVSSTLKGYSFLTGPLAFVNLPNNLLSADVTLPATTMMSVYHKLNPRLAVMGTAIYTQWDVFKTLQLNNVVGPTSLITVTQDENFKNTWRLVVGADYQATEKLMLRAGVGMDDSPVIAVDRTARLPDDDRIAVAVGARFQVNDSIRADVGYTHIFINDTNLNYTSVTGPQAVTYVAKVNSKADVIGGQITWTIS